MSDKKPTGSIEQALQNTQGDAFINPNYGTGIFRRRIRLTALPGSGPRPDIFGELEDTQHGFRTRIEHDGERVTAIHGDPVRYPASTCPGALEPLQELVGITLGTSAEDINKNGNPFANCTHLYDLSILAIVHARGLSGGALTEVLYDVTVTDETDEGSEACVYRDGALVHRWLTRSFAVVEPQALQGNTLFKGFSAWARQSFEGDALEAAHVLQKGYFVAQSQRFDTSKLAGTPLDDAPSRRNVCHSYSDGIAETAVRLGTNTRDFNDSPELLLQFK